MNIRKIQHFPCFAAFACCFRGILDGNPHLHLICVIVPAPLLNYNEYMKFERGSIHGENSQQTLYAMVSTRL